jgi:hypothetical protein
LTQISPRSPSDGISAGLDGFSFDLISPNGSAEVLLAAGSYWVATRFLETEWDDRDGVVPRWFGGDPHALSAAYRLTLEGDVAVSQLYEGNLDGTFTITNIPEPGAFALALGALLLAASERRRSFLK